jgi:hypothetical protein
MIVAIAVTIMFFSPRVADGCFSPPMHQPSRSRPAESAAHCFLGGIGPTRARSDRPAGSAGVIAMRGIRVSRNANYSRVRR